MCIGRGPVQGIGGDSKIDAMKVETELVQLTVEAGLVKITVEAGGRFFCFQNWREK